RFGRPPRAQNADALKSWTIGGLPIVEQIIQLWIQSFRRRIPWFQKEIIDVCLVDGADGGIGVSIRGKQRPFGLRINSCGFLKKSNSIHVGHALVGEEQGNIVVADLELL